MIDFYTIFQSAIVTAISGIITNIFYILIFVWGVKKLIKKIPEWIEQYDRVKLKNYAIERAVVGRK